MSEMRGYEWDAYDPVPDKNLKAYNAIQRELGGRILSPDTYNEIWLKKIADEFGGETNGNSSEN